MVTAKGARPNTVVGLEVGADDYITKPYRIRELVARLRALLRRAGMVTANGAGGTGPPSGAGTPSLVVGDVALDSDEHLVTVGGDPVSMPLKEFELLHLLLSNVGRVLPRELLI